MRIVFASAAALGLLLAASNAFAQAQPQEVSQPTTTSATTGPGSSTSAAPQLICRPVVYEGMIVPNKQDCHTQREWDSIRQHSRQQVDQIQLNNLTTQMH